MIEVGELSDGRAAAGGERREASGEMIEVGELSDGRAAAGGERREASGEMIENTMIENTQWRPPAD